MKKIASVLFVIFILLFTTITIAETVNDAEPLHADKAFQLSVKLNQQQQIVAHWNIAPGYKLYKQRIHFSAKPEDAIKLGTITLPKGIEQHDNIFGDYEIYKKDITVTIPVIQARQTQFKLTVNYQGCAESGFCYPPQQKSFNLTLAHPILATVNNSVGNPINNTQNKISQLLSTGSTLWIIFGFLGFGLLLAFTPCVLPMIPILSGIIIGENKQLSTKRAFSLSLIYVLSMASTYAIAGVITGLLGASVQAWLQQPWVIISFSLLFVLLALSLFDVYELRLPGFLHHHLHMLSQKQKSGNYLGVAIMGILATLIASPCVSPPLIGTLAYIGESGNALLGGLALFMMGIGMGIPLIIIGTTEGKLLPKTGRWMIIVKRFFGAALIAMAIWFASRTLPNSVTMLLWAIFFICIGVYLGALERVEEVSWQRLWKGFGVIALTYGIILVIGGASGNHDPLSPLANIQLLAKQHTTSNMNEPKEFKKVNDIKELDMALQQARKQGKRVMLDFYADWCISCIEMEKQTFNKPKVQQALKNIITLKADVTDNKPSKRELEHRLKVYAPPTIVFFNEQGKECSSYRIVGKMSTEQFLKHIAALSKSC